ncbi:MAG TPA: DUF3089 domain-containing protein [Solirubrobacteraceae bacterium]|nr:DUF3089 domain-containing protein [Solirubrobacteraceae bacterium]
MGAAPPGGLLTRAIRVLLATAALALCGMAAAGAATARTVWLCQPGHSPDPCRVSLTTTVFSPSLHKLRVLHPKPATKPAIDCFYVYPTVSDQPTPLSGLHIDPEESSVALFQAARYSQHCRVFAPMYRQVTLSGLFSGKLTSRQTAIPLSDVRAAFATYMRRYNHGRGFVLIGHSQGSFVLEQLIAKDIDSKPAVRRRLVSAILLGGDVLVKHGTNGGGTLHHIPACRSATQLGCVIAFSTFGQTPPADSLFGRTRVKGDQVLCTNPAALSGGAANVDVVYPSASFAAGTQTGSSIALLKIPQLKPPTPWVSLPGAYRARCSAAGGANVLMVSPLGGAPILHPVPDATWGLHLVDANIALGNLISIVHAEANAYAARPSAPLAPTSGHTSP